MDKLSLVIFIFILGLFVRFYNFPNRITFGPEQALSLSTSGEYLKKGVTLLGMPYIQRVTSSGHFIFESPIFNYSLIPLLIIFRYDPLLITAYFTSLNLLTAFLLFYLYNRIKNLRVAIFALLLFLFNNYMIYHSMFIWILNYLPLLGLLSFYLFYLYFKNQKQKYVLVLGIISGICLGLEYVYFFTLILLVGLLIYFSKRKCAFFFIFISGLVIGELPVVIFDIRHQFYNIKTLWEYTMDVFYQNNQGRISYYHLLHFWPLLAFLGGLILSNLFERNKTLAILLILFYLIANFSSGIVSFNESIGMNNGLTYPLLDSVAKAIKYDNPKDFNVAELLDFDSRAHNLRYLLEFRYQLIPRGEEDYPGARTLYVFAHTNYNFQQALAWEIRSYAPYKVGVLSPISRDYTLYKLTKQ